MSDKTYRLLLGTFLLVSLYFEIGYLMYFLIGMLFFEGITNLRLPLLFRKALGKPETRCQSVADLPSPRFNFEAERVWRLVVGLMLAVTYLGFYNTLWFFPWFMGFVIFGAGASGVCPGLLGFKWAGFR